MKKCTFLMVLGVLAFMLAPATAIAADFQWVEDFSDISDWTLHYGNGAISSDGDIATLTGNFGGNAGEAWFQKTGLAVDLGTYWHQQVMLRKPAELAAYHVYGWITLFDENGSNISYSNWVEIPTTWFNPMAMYWQWGTPTLSKVHLAVRSTDVPAGMLTKLEADFWVWSVAGAPEYTDDPVIPEPASLLFLATGALGLGGLIRRRAQ